MSIKKTIFYLGISTLLLTMSSCVSEDETVTELPTVTSSTTSSNVVLTYTTIEISGNVSSDGGSNITARGVCWNTSPSPTIANDKTSEASNSFTSQISNLIANTTYYFRVYATNNNGTSYGTEQSFSTLSLDDTSWDFYLIHDADISWHADVTFNADGTTVYDEPSYPGIYLTNGTWSLDGNELTYSLDGSNDPNFYYFTGTLLENAMSGTYNFGTETKTWSASIY